MDAETAVRTVLGYGAVPLLGIFGALLALILGGLLLRLWHRRRAARGVAARLRQVCDDMLTGVLLPDPDLGPIHLEFLLFTRHGVTVVDIREAHGNVFGSEGMQEWTVLSGNRRYTFANPLPALHDRIAAIRRLLPEMPVQGYVAFNSGADFSKGRPPNVIVLDELIAGMGRSSRSPDDMGTQQLLEPLWQRLKREVTTASTRASAA
jgi:hypothetical protein